jgi:hypothetical protein
MIRPVTPPASLKVFAPDGTSKEFKGWIGTRPSGNNPFRPELYLMKTDHTTEVVNKKVVVYNTDANEVIYDPRMAPSQPTPIRKWLEEHPEWPAILELYDQPVEEDPGDGIKPEKA